MLKYQIHIHNLHEMKGFAAKLSALLYPKDLLALRGNLGAGKSTLARSLIQSLDPKIKEVPSPTFTLVQHYDLPSFTLYHYDLYRLKQAEELFELDIEEALSGVVIAEWPDLLFDLNFPFHCLICDIDFGKDEEERYINLSYDKSWKERIDALIA